jgi:HEAT repeat protein
MKNLLVCLMVFPVAVGCQTAPDRQADGQRQGVLLENIGSPPPTPRTGYVPENLPPQLLVETRKRLADTTPAGEQRWQTLLACLTVEQKQALIWSLMILETPSDFAKSGYTLDILVKSVGADIAETLIPALHHKEEAVRRRACELAGNVGFDQQGPDRLDPKFIPLIDALVTAALQGKSEEDRLAALEALAQFHAHPTPWVHRLAALLDDASPAIRREVTGALSNCGPIAAPYMKQMLEQFNVAGDREEARRAAWIMDEAGWTPAEVGPQLVRHISRIYEALSQNQVGVLSYPISNMPASDAMADALLTLSPMHLCHYEICGWIEAHAAGDRRFIAPLLAALEKDWTCESYERIATCFYTEAITEALVAVGRGDTQLVATLTARLQRPIPTDARLYVGRTLSQLTGEPRYLVEALQWVLEHHQEKAAVYTEDRVVEMLADVDLSLTPRLDSYRAQLVAIVNSMGQGDPTGYFILTGDLDPLMAWARRDLQNTYKNNLCSSVMEDVADKFGPLLEPLVGQLTGLIRESDDYDQHGVCAALIPLGPDPAAEGLKAEMLALAGRFEPSSRVEPALALWSCTRNTDAALSILLPLLDDTGWGTTRASWALGQMGRDAAPALGRLRQIARGPNPAYAKSASEAIELIETELSRPVTFEQMWQELGSDNALESIRALWRLVDLGEQAADKIREYMKQGSPAQLPGRRIRHHARAEQVLRILARITE